MNKPDASEVREVISEVHYGPDGLEVRQYETANPTDIRDLAEQMKKNGRELASVTVDEMMEIANRLAQLRAENKELRKRVAFNPDWLQSSEDAKRIWEGIRAEYHDRLQRLEAVAETARDLIGGAALEDGAVIPGKEWETWQLAPGTMDALRAALGGGEEV